MTTSVKKVHFGTCPVRYIADPVWCTVLSEQCQFQYICYFVTFIYIYFVTYELVIHFFI